MHLISRIFWWCDIRIQIWLVLRPLLFATWMLPLQMKPEAPLNPPTPKVIRPKISTKVRVASITLRNDGKFQPPQPNNIDDPVPKTTKIVSSKIFKYTRKRKEAERKISNVKSPNDKLGSTMPVHSDLQDFAKEREMSKIQRLLRTWSQINNLIDPATEKHSSRRKKYMQRNRSQHELISEENGFSFEKSSKHAKESSVFYYNPQSPTLAMDVLRDDTAKLNNAPPSPRFGDISFGQ